MVSETPDYAIRQVREALVRAAEESNKQARTMLRLTWAIVVLTLAMLALVGVQVFIALRPPQ